MKEIKDLPSLKGLGKTELIETLLREEYGYLPERPTAVSAVLLREDSSFCAGKAPLRELLLTCNGSWGEFSFPIYYVCPRKKKNVPCFLHINFRDSIPDRYQPTEELIDNGFATITFCYRDVSSDDADFTNGLAGVVYPNGERGEHSCGKLGLWAWAAMAVMDFAMTLDELDHTKISVVGHSRLGKTALLAGALDERFYCAFSNDSGCCGAALSREKGGETIKRITSVFPYWFSQNFLQYADREKQLPFDQHWLIAANAPHKVYVSSAAEDSWACPENEYLSCVAASSYYAEHGLRGLSPSDGMPENGVCLHGGDIGYHIREGAHYFSREDWLSMIRFLRG